MIGYEQIPTALTLTPEDRSTLESWVRAGKTERRLAERARMVLAAADGQSTLPSPVRSADGPQPSASGEYVFPKLV